MRILYYALLIVGGLSTLASPVGAVAIVGVGQPALLLDSFVLNPAFYVTGALAFWKQPQQRAAQHLLAIGALLATSHALGYLLTLVLRDSQPPLLWLLNLISQLATCLAFASWVALFAVFPDGAYERPYERWVTRIVGVAAGLIAVLAFFAEPLQTLTVELVFPAPQTRTPFSLPEPASFADAYRLILLCPLIALALFALRYHRADAERRAQMRWPLIAAVLVGVAFLAQPLVSPLAPGWITDSLFVLAVSSLPVSLVIGILRHRLFDVDLLLRRSLVYAILWLAIALSYATIAALLGLAAGQRFSVSVAVLVTIAASMVFQPARRALERLADRLVFGARLTRYELIRRFGSTLEAVVELDELLPMTQTTVQAGMDARWARVSLAGAQAAHGSAGDGHDAAEPPSMIVPIRYGGEIIGTIDCGPKREGAYSAADRALLETLARQAALAIRTAHLTADLQARLDELHRQKQELMNSRTRLAQAQESERRRIERDLHDGIQQQMVAVMAKVALARALIPADPVRAERMMVETQEMARQAHVDLREFVRGIHPAILGDRGLEEAIQAQVAQLPIGVQIEVDPALNGLRFAPEIEGAAYFLIAEGLTNVMKHAATDQATVALRRVAGGLLVEVCDQGCGFDPLTEPLVGLSGLRDRLEALGGTMFIAASPCQGVRVSGILPVETPVAIAEASRG